MRRPLLYLAPLAGALVLAGCGAARPTRAPASASATTVAARASRLGTYLTDGSGRALYLFAADTTSTSTCTSACASIWPPLTTAHAPVAGPGVMASQLGVTRRSDGTTEVTYDGHPLYHYVGDSAAGDVTGQGLNQFGGLWWLVAPSGHRITVANGS